jgi:hypothetical protein
MVHVKRQVHGVQTNGWQRIFFAVVIAKSFYLLAHADWKLLDVFLGHIKLFDFDQTHQRLGTLWNAPNGKNANAMYLRDAETTINLGLEMLKNSFFIDCHESLRGN